MLKCSICEKEYDGSIKPRPCCIELRGDFVCNDCIDCINRGSELGWNPDIFPNGDTIITDVRIAWQNFKEIDDSEEFNSDGYHSVTWLNRKMEAMNKIDDLLGCD